MAEVPIGYFPDLPFKWDLSPGRIFRTTVLTKRGGSKQRRREFKTGGYETYSGTILCLSHDIRKQVKDFLNSLEGQLNSFYFHIPNWDKLVNYEVGSVSNSNQFQTSLKKVQLTQVTVDGTPVGFSVVSGLGAGGEDMIVFTQSRTGVVRVTGLARRRIVAILSQDGYSETFTADVTGERTLIKVSLEEV
jgi:hypothetical protein